MKKLITFPENASKIRRDHLDCYRSEGRFCINIAFAASLLGYESYIVIKGLEGGKKEVYKNVYLVPYPEKFVYDKALFFSHEYRIKEIKSKSNIFMFHWPSIVKGVLNKFSSEKDISIVCPYRQRSKLFEKGVLYLPPVYPLLPFRNSFFPYRDLRTGKDSINIYICLDAHVKLPEKYYYKIELILFELSKIYNNINLWIQAKDGIFPSSEKRLATLGNEIQSWPLKDFSINKKIHLIPGLISYEHLLNIFHNIDLAIIRVAAGSSGACQYDLISSGIPIIPIAQSINELRDNYVSPLYGCFNRFMHDSDSDEETKEKFGIFMENSEDFYNEFKQTMLDSQLDNWKKIVLDQDIF